MEIMSACSLRGVPLGQKCDIHLGLHAGAETPMWLLSLELAKTKVKLHMSCFLCPTSH